MRIRVVQEAVAALEWVVAEKDRSALARRLKRGRVVYQSDPAGSELTERIDPDGTRTLGRLINRRFVPAGVPGGAVAVVLGHRRCPSRPASFSRRRTS
jgi:hypothetical protein